MTLLLKKKGNLEFIDGELSITSGDGGYVHLTQSVINSGGIVTIVNSDGTSVLNAEEATGRGVSVFEQYYSEIDNCIYEIQKQFHKGNVYVSKPVVIAEWIDVDLNVNLDENPDADVNVWEYFIDKDLVRTQCIWRD